MQLFLLILTPLHDNILNKQINNQPFQLKSFRYLKTILNYKKSKKAQSSKAAQQHLIMVARKLMWNHTYFHYLLGNTCRKKARINCSLLLCVSQPFPNEKEHIQPTFSRKNDSQEQENLYEELYEVDTENDSSALGKPHYSLESRDQKSLSLRSITLKSFTQEFQTVTALSNRKMKVTLWHELLFNISKCYRN